MGGCFNDFSCTMHFIIDIGHPAQVYLLKNVYAALIEKGFTGLILTRDIPAVTDLLDEYDLPYRLIGTKKHTLFGKFIHQHLYNFRVFRILQKYKPKLAIGTSVTVAHAARFSKTVSIILDDDDDDIQPLFTKYVHPFANIILSPDCIKRKAKQTIYYHSIHELSYLHPKVWQPDQSVLQKVGLKEGAPFFLLRFNKFKAHHDRQHYGLSLEQKRILVNTLSQKGKVFISAEGDIEPDFQPYLLHLPLTDIHSLMAYATMFVGDSQTMTTEAAVLGVPALKCNTFAGKLSVPNYLEQAYGLCYAFQPHDFDKMMAKIELLLSNKHLKSDWAKKQQQFVASHICLSDFYVWFIENYPQSVEIMKENPDYQDVFT